MNACNKMAKTTSSSECFRVVCIVCVLFLLLPVSHGADLTYDLDEEKPTGTLVGNAGADYDLRSIMTAEEYRNLGYQILASGNDYAHYFRIVNNTGELFTVSPIDRDTLPICQRVSKCIISLGIGVATIGSFFRRIDIDINLSDVNDNFPTFPSPVDTVHFQENSAEREMTSIAGARDIDSGNFSVMNYYVDTPDAPFRVEMEKFVDGSSLVKVIVAGKLDREDKGFYRIRVVAEDGGSPKKTGAVEVDITITDINDNSPVFEKLAYNVTLNEDTPNGTVFETISATDMDLGQNGEVEYRLSPFNTEKVKGLFAINSTTGALKVINQLEYVPNEEIIIYVEAFDKGDNSKTSRVVVYVNIKDSNNNPPQINVNILQGGDGKARITEYANIGSPVAHIAVIDHDDANRNGKVDCIAISNYFTLERYEDKQYKAVVAEALNRELADKHEVTIVCQDSGSPPLNSTTNFTVIVLDENDNKPRFTSSVYYPKVTENNAIGAVVARVTADDVDIGENARITYSLLDTAGYPFYIEASSGNIRANFTLDRENVTKIELLVQAEDHGQPRLSSSATVILFILDENDNIPKFDPPNYEFFVSENLAYNTSVDQLSANDPDDLENGTVTFSFGQQPQANFPFVLYSNGSIKVVGNLDRERQSVYRFTVVASDQGKPSLSTSVTVTVNVLDQNDNGPVFLFPDDDNNTASIPLNSEPESVGIQIIADDKDAGSNGQVSYQILDDNVTNLFYIENEYGCGVTSESTGAKNYYNCGIIRIHRLPGDGEASIYVLRLKAEDSGSPKRYSTKTLTVSFTQTDAPVENRQNFLIAVTLGCVTVVLSIIIVITIYFIRRSDIIRKNNTHNQSYSDKADLQIIPPEIKHPGDLGGSSSGSKDSLKKVSFSTDNNSSLELELNRPHSPMVNMENIKMLDNSRIPPNATSSPRTYSTTSHVDHDPNRLDPATVLQIHRSLLQSHDQIWANHRDGHTPPLTKDMLSQHEDNGSESSGETATCDSGRGGSESDIQTSMSQSHDNDHIKTVTFANKPKLHHIPKDNQWPDVIDYPYHPYKHTSNMSMPVLPTRDYLRSPTSPHSPNTPSSSHRSSFPTFNNKLPPLNDTVSHMTSYDDDDETTTSGSYTIDNDHDWMADSKPRPYFLSHNEAYC